MMERDDRSERAQGKRLFWGITLIVLGTLAALQYLHFLPWTIDAMTWPFVVIVLGAVRCATAWSAEKLGGGVTMMLMGAWFWIATHGWHGFTWSNSWPLALVAGGAGMVVHALATPFYRRRRDDGVVHVDVR